MVGSFEPVGSLDMVGSIKLVGSFDMVLAYFVCHLKLSPLLMDPQTRDLTCQMFVLYTASSLQCHAVYPKPDSEIHCAHLENP